ncbi:MAG TPA: hypothetical protein VK088_05000, partial [Acidimicrobiia bacterium]|nr:hypothetical protein [Acidimicrobiia bacterium]
MPSHVSRRRWRIIALVGLGALVFVAAGITVTYAADASGEPQTLRGLTIDGHAAGHLTRPELQRVISRVANEVSQREVQINLPDGSRTFLAAELGI